MTDLFFIPYFITSRYRVETMVELSNVKRGEKVADLGSGDGRISIAFGEKDAVVHGFELNSELVLLSEKHIKKANLTGTVTIHQKDFWLENLSSFDIICMYPMPDIMPKLEEKLEKELKKGARVLLNYYPFPTWKEQTEKDNIYLYQKS